MTFKYVYMGKYPYVALSERLSNCTIRTNMNAVGQQPVSQPAVLALIMPPTIEDGTPYSGASPKLRYNSCETYVGSVIIYEL